MSSCDCKREKKHRHRRCRRVERVCEYNVVCSPFNPCNQLWRNPCGCGVASCVGGCGYGYGGYYGSAYGYPYGAGLYGGAGCGVGACNCGWSYGCGFDPCRLNGCPGLGWGGACGAGACGSTLYWNQPVAVGRGVCGTGACGRF